MNKLDEREQLILMNKLDEREQLISSIREAVARYMQSEGCTCCQNSDHGTNGDMLAVLLNVEPYEDGSGYNFSKYIPKN